MVPGKPLALETNQEGYELLSVTSSSLLISVRAPHIHNGYVYSLGMPNGSHLLHISPKPFHSVKTWSHFTFTQFRRLKVTYFIYTLLLKRLHFIEKSSFFLSFPIVPSLPPLPNEITIHKWHRVFTSQQKSLSLSQLLSLSLSLLSGR